MKHYIIASLIALLMAFNPAKAQNYDIRADFGLSSVVIPGTPAPELHMPEGFRTPVVYTIQNVGSDTLRAGQSFRALFTDNGTQFYDSDTIYFTGDIAPDSILFYHSPIGFEYTMDPNIPNHQICIDVTLDSVEVNDDNNSKCLVYLIKSGITIDWSVDSLKMVGPTFEQPWNINNYDNPVPDYPDTILIYFTNNSDVVYTPHHEFTITLFRSGSFKTKSFSLPRGVLPYAADSVKIFNPFEMPAFPNDSGEYNICAYGKFFMDADTLNDTTCTFFRIIDTYDPTNPDNWPVGINELMSAPAMHYMNDAIRFKNVAGQIVCRIFDITGRMILMESTNENAAISTGHIPPGIYVVQATKGSAPILSEKIVIARN